MTQNQTPSTPTSNVQDFDSWLRPVEYESAGSWLSSIVNDIINRTPDPPPPNEAPVARIVYRFSQPWSVGVENRSTVLREMFVDPEGQPLTYTMSNLPTGLSFDQSSLRIVGTPTTPQTSTVTVTARDPQGATGSYNFEMRVVPNKPPVQNLSDLVLNMKVGKAYGFTFPRTAFIDPEGQSLSYRLDGLPPGISINPTTWRIEGTPTSAGTSTVTVTATDAQGMTTTDTFSIRISENSAPILSGTISITQRNVDERFEIDLDQYFRDPDHQEGDDIEYSVFNLPSGIQFEGNRIFGRSSDVGTHTVTVIPRDGDTVGEPVRFDITIVQPNRPPEVGAEVASVTAEIGENLDIKIPEASFSDPDGDRLTLSASNFPDGLSLVRGADGRYSVVGSINESGLHQLTIIARDPDGATVRQTLNLTINQPPPPPPQPAIAVTPVNGDAGANRLEGTAARDVLNGLGGDDHLFGREGDDTLNGGVGNDRLYGNVGSDTLNGGAGNDRLYIDEHDIVDGGLGRDHVFWQGSSGANLAIVSSRAATIRPGQQRLVNVETVSGGSQRDIIRDYSNGSVTLYGDAGNDDLFGGTGNDTLYGGSGNDNLRGGAGNDLLRGSSGVDRLYGQSGADVLNGGNGNDFLYGGIGDDVIYGATSLFGIWFLSEGSDHIEGGDGNDEIYFDGTDTVDGGRGTDIGVWNGSGATNIVLSLTANGRLNAGQQRLLNVEVFQGGAGNDVVRDQTNLGVKIFGGAGNDRLFGGSGDDYLQGAQGVDTIRGGDGDDTLRGHTGNDSLYGDAGDDRLYGDDGNDRLFGGAGVDVLVGGAGDDTLTGEAGRDYLYGQAGADKFVLAGEAAAINSDIIRDFQRGSDKISITGLFNVKAMAVDLDGNGQNDSLLILTGTTAANRVFYGIVDGFLDLSAADFVQADGSAFSSVEIL